MKWDYTQFASYLTVITSFHMKFWNDVSEWRAFEYMFVPAHAHIGVSIE